MKKLLTLVLALVMVMSAFAFTAMAEDDVVTATGIVFTSPGFTPKKDTYGVNYIKENYGLYVDVLPVDSATDESWNVFWNDGYADIIIPYGAQMPKLIDQDLCRTIDFEMMKENMPRLYKMMQQVFGSDEQILSALTYKGEVYCIPYFGDTSNTAFVNIIRKDWLAKVGLEVPTTIDELTEVLRAFTEDDPDGNGVNDTYGATGESYGLYNVAASFGTSRNLAYVIEDGVMTCNATSEEYHNYLRQMAAWFAAGYLDPESVTDNSDRQYVRNKWANGRMGILADHPWWVEMDRGDVGPLQMLLAANPDMGWDNFALFGGLANGEYTGGVLRNWVDPRGQAAVYFGYDASDDVVLKMMQLIDSTVVFYDDTEEDYKAIGLKADMHTGIEGQDWDWNEDHTRIVLNPTATAGYLGNYASDMGFYLFPSAACTDYSKFVGREDEFAIDAYAIGTGEPYVWAANNFPKAALSGDLADVGDLVNTTFNTWKWDFIMGDKDVEADWDAYVAEIEAAGLQSLIDFYAADQGL